MYYIKRHDIKNDTTVIEAKCNNEDLAHRIAKDLCEQEDLLPHTSCVFSVEDTEENKRSYIQIARDAGISSLLEEGIPIDPQIFTDEAIIKFKNSL